MQFSQVGNQETLVFWDQLSYTKIQGNPLVRASNETWVGKKSETNGHFWPTNRYISETVEDRHMVTIYTNRKSQMSFQVVPLLMTLNNRNAPPYPIDEDTPILSTARRQSRVCRFQQYADCAWIHRVSDP